MNVQTSSTRSISKSRDRRPVYLRVKGLSLIQFNFEWYIRYVYYAFVFSIPFEMADINPSGLLTIAKLIGYLLVPLAFLQPSLCFKRPPKPVWYFAAYLAVCMVRGVLLMAGDTVDPDFSRLFVIRLLSRVQMLGLFWIAYNLFHQEQVVKGTLVALSLSTILIVLLQFGGLAGETAGQHGRVTAFDANPNSVATVLSLGFLAVFGLAYGREKTEWKSHLLFWTTSGIVAAAIVRTGARGAAAALALSFGVLLFKKGDIAKKFKMGVLGLMGISVLTVISYQLPAVRNRWEATLLQGTLAKREQIFPAAFNMFLESPLLGWGVINHYLELGARFGRPQLDPHNMYLYLLTEVGLIGSIPFLVGVTICLLAAWRSRFNIQGVTPLMMMSFLLISNLNGSYQDKKLFWLVLAYGLASASYTAVRKQSASRAFAAASRRQSVPRYHALRRTVRRPLP
jgi:O-antigen ligase